MISVEEARQKILSKTSTIGTEKVHPQHALGQYLADTVFSPHPLPLFDNSAMDGYAVRYQDTISANDSQPVSLQLTEVLPAGSANAAHLQSQQTAQVLTGAMIAPGADAVIRQEDVQVQDGFVRISRPVVLGENVRYRAEEIKAGDILLPKGAKLTPASIGLLTGAGVSEVEVYVRPRLGIVTTGSEVIAPDEDLSPGKIFNSNAFALAAALRQAGFEISFYAHGVDDEVIIHQLLSEAVANCDIVLVTGGVSVGEFDYVKKVIADLGALPVFWKVKQKPGKPLFFATAGEKLLFGLPGNPASALVCFYEYVLPCIRRCTGSSNACLRSLSATMLNGYKKKAGLTHYLKGRLREDGTVEALDRQGSHMMSSFAMADCLIVVPEEAEEICEGDKVEVHLLPA